MRDIKVKNLKAKQIYFKYGYTIYYCGGCFVLSFYGYFGKFATLKELKTELKKINPQLTK